MRFPVFLTLTVLVFIMAEFSEAHGQTPIAVLEFEGKGVSDDEASALTDRLRIELFETGNFKVIERDQMDKIFTEQNFQMTGFCSSALCAVQAGKILGVPEMVAGSISKVGNVFSISARIVDVETGEYIKTATRDHEGNIGVLLKIGMKEIAMKLAEADKSQQVEQIPIEIETDTVAPLQIAAADTHRVTFRPRYRAPEKQRTKFWLGFKAGGSYSTMITDEEMETDGVVGPLVGIWARFPINSNTGLQAEILFAGRGIGSLDMTYLDIPFFMTTKLPTGDNIRPGVFGGFVVSILLSANITIDGRDAGGDTLGPMEIDVKDSFSSSILGLVFGAEVDAELSPLLLSFEVRMALGLTNSFKETDIEGNTAIYTSISAMVGAAF